MEFIRTTRSFFEKIGAGIAIIQQRIEVRTTDRTLVSKIKVAVNACADIVAYIDSRLDPHG